MSERRARNVGRRASDPEAAFSQERLRDFAESAAEWFFEMDAGLRLVYLSPRYSQVTGTPREAVLGCTRRELAESRGELDGPELDAERMRRHLECLERHEPYVDFRYARRGADGRLFWLSVSGKPIFDEAGSFRGYRGVGRDVTAEVRAEERLRESESRYRDLLELVSDWVWETDPAGRFTMSSERIGEKLGIDESSWLGRTGPDILAEYGAGFDGDASLLEAYKEALRTGRPFGPVVYRYDEPGQLPRFMEVTGRPRYEADGTFAGFRGTGTDVTERVRAERALEALVDERTRELEAAQRDLLRAERLATIGRLTATVSHELRNPLGTIAATFHALRMGLDGLPEDAEQRVERIGRNIDRCVRIIEGLLDFTRTRTPSLEDVDVDAWLAETVDEVVLDTEVALSTALASGARAAIDAGRMHQAVANLVENALAAMRDAPREEAHRLTVASRLEGDEVVIAVSDTGGGIAPEDLEHVFEPLFSTRTFGTGLGLPLVRQIAGEHGGTAHVAETSPEGTTATIRLPLAAP